MPPARSSAQDFRRGGDADEVEVEVEGEGEGEGGWAMV